MKPGEPIRIYALIDALGWPYVEQSHFLADVLPYRTPLRTVLGFSSGAVPTILTGRPPAETGHWNLFYYDPEGSPFRWLRYLRFLPGSVLDHRVTRKLLKEMGRHVLGMGPLFECCVSPRLLPWFNWVEKRNLYEPGGVTGLPSIFDELAQSGIRYRVYSYHRYTDAEIFRQAERALQRGEADVLFLYLSEMDMFLHTHCHEPSAVAQRLDWYAAELRSLFQLARWRHPDSTLLVFSDHGMTRVCNHYDLVGDVESLGWRMPKDYLAVYDSTMARFWFFNPDARRSIAARLAGVECGRILLDGELQQLGVFFPDRRYGELVFLLHPGWLLAKSDFNGNGWKPAGMHGYHPDDPGSDAIFLSDREPPAAMRTVADLYVCMRHAAGITPQKENDAA